MLLRCSTSRKSLSILTRLMNTGHAAETSQSFIIAKTGQHNQLSTIQVIVSIYHEYRVHGCTGAHGIEGSGNGHGNGNDLYQISILCKFLVYD